MIPEYTPEQVFPHLAAVLFQLPNTPVQVDIGGMLVESKVWKNGTVRCLDIPVGMKDGVHVVRFLEQNPAKDSPPGRRARAGAKICWVILDGKKPWLGRVENGIWYPDTSEE